MTREHVRDIYFREIAETARRIAFPSSTGNAEQDEAQAVDCATTSVMLDLGLCPNGHGMMDAGQCGECGFTCNR